MWADYIKTSIHVLSVWIQCAYSLSQIIQISIDLPKIATGNNPQPV